MEIILVIGVVLVIAIYFFVSSGKKEEKRECPVSKNVPQVKPVVMPVVKVASVVKTEEPVNVPVKEEKMDKKSFKKLFEHLQFPKAAKVLKSAKGTSDFEWMSEIAIQKGCVNSVRVALSPIVDLNESGLITEAVEKLRSVPCAKVSRFEKVVMVVLETNDIEMINTVLSMFETLHAVDHNDWVHSLSHFTKMMWKQRLTKWIRRFNQIAFVGTSKGLLDNCSDRLVHDFAEFAQ